ncbi:MAG: hypothetical protein N3A62_06775 [Thermodesulfovibrionales bacterium]|nr:hypothetical protein [Thermodesulfovibrionales bacterium]
MDIEIINDSEIVIKGHIAKMENYFELKKALKTLIENGANSIKIKIPDSVTITSSAVGLFLRTINEDNVKISLIVGNDHLYSLLDSLKMLEVFNVKRM